MRNRYNGCTGVSGNYGRASRSLSANLSPQFDRCCARDERTRSGEFTTAVGAVAAFAEIRRRRFYDERIA